MFMVGSLLRFGSIAVWVFHIIACMGQYCLLEQSSCCLGCDNRPHLIPSLEGSLKSQHNHHAWKKASKSTLSEDYWTTSTYDMDNNAFQSCGSISSACTLTQTHDVVGAGNSYRSSDFVNHGLIQWNLIRKKWVGNNKSPGQAQQHHEPSLSTRQKPEWSSSARKGSPPYLCGECNKRFKSEGGFNYHLRIEHAKIYANNLWCRKSTHYQRDSQRLKNHLCLTPTPIERGLREDERLLKEAEEKKEKKQEEQEKKKKKKMEEEKAAAAAEMKALALKEKAPSPLPFFFLLRFLLFLFLLLLRFLPKAFVFS
ncbi:zinc finger and BTB domain-containing protein 39 [Striga asiatica]|uniref:Zinc finger and BTB domain-containing protein 39 n=1 Tax=Striga asiatica TaxID=4170 RepID=A0A5A7PGN0_STRAF|nr:zinc finger and BTB domain-containing protein 39 [Striga asiatica]